MTLPLSQAVSPIDPARYAAAAALALPAAQALSCWLIFALTLRPGRGRSLTDWRADVASLVGTATAVTLWAVSRGAVAPAAALLVIEGIGIVRTAWWAWHSPGCEPVLPWCIWAACGGFEFFAVPAGASWVAAWFYPAFYVACGLLVAAAAGKRRAAAPAAGLRGVAGEAGGNAVREHTAGPVPVPARTDGAAAGVSAPSTMARARGCM